LQNAQSILPTGPIVVRQPGLLTRLRRTVEGGRTRSALIGTERDCAAELQQSVAKCRKGLVRKLLWTLLGAAGMSAAIALTAGTAGLGVGVAAIAAAAFAVCAADAICAAMAYRNAKALVSGKPEPHPLPMGADSIANLLHKAFTACGVPPEKALRPAGYGSLVLRAAMFIAGLVSGAVSLSAADSLISTTYGVSYLPEIAKASGAFVATIVSTVAAMGSTWGDSAPQSSTRMRAVREAHRRHAEVEAALGLPRELVDLIVLHDDSSPTVSPALLARAYKAARGEPAEPRNEAVAAFVAIGFGGSEQAAA
jgi:hypothetical protein